MSHRSTLTPAAIARRTRQLVVSVLMAVVLASCAAAAVQPAAASADARGTQGFKLGSLTHQIVGNGQYVRHHSARFVAFPTPLCNWRIDFRYYAVDGRGYSPLRGPTNNTFDRYGTHAQYLGQWVGFGRACAELFANGELRARQCHSITR